MQVMFRSPFAPPGEPGIGSLVFLYTETSRGCQGGWIIFSTPFFRRLRPRRPTAEDSRGVDRNPPRREERRTHQPRRHRHPRPREGWGQTKPPPKPRRGRRGRRGRRRKDGDGGVCPKTARHRSQSLSRAACLAQNPPRQLNPLFSMMEGRPPCRPASEKRPN